MSMLSTLKSLLDISLASIDPSNISLNIEVFDHDEDMLGTLKYYPLTHKFEGSYRTDREHKTFGGEIDNHFKMAILDKPVNIPEPFKKALKALGVEEISA